MRLLDQLNAVPGSLNSVLYGPVAELPRLMFSHNKGDGYTAVPTPMRYPAGSKALVAFAAWANLAGRFEVGPARDRKSTAVLQCEVILAGTPVRVLVPVTGLSVQAAIDLVDSARMESARG